MASALVVLGCRVGGGPSSALERRIRAAASIVPSSSPALVVASGGRSWGGVMEADHIAERLRALGVPAASIVRERCSHSTRENAVYSARIVASRGVTAAIVVTCAWHLARALDAFRAEGLDVRGHPAEEGAPPSWLTRASRRAREWGARRLDGVRA
jgi:uncharacterized SAM-binding protein YcdF (DUF218 family)